MIINQNNINIKYESYFGLNEASLLLKHFEDNVKYLNKDFSKVCVFNKWHFIPRKHIAFGDSGIKYTFSKITVDALPWPDFLLKVKVEIEDKLNESFNFALVNRYASGDDYMGEHRDNEPMLDPLAPIVSLSLGQDRPFIFRHKSLVHISRYTTKDLLKDFPTFYGPKKYEINLKHGSLLTMFPPTNQYWYHSLPKRKRSKGVRINITFRRLLTKSH